MIRAVHDRSVDIAGLSMIRAALGRYLGIGLWGDFRRCLYLSSIFGRFRVLVGDYEPALARNILT